MKLRNIFSVFLVLCMVVTLLPLSASAETIIASGKHDFGPVEWKVTSSGTLTISGNRSIQPQVTYAWWDYADIITKVIVEDGLKTIPEKAFWNMQNITEVYIGNTVTTIHENAFSGCTGLTAVTIPDSVTEIEQYAFYNCSSLAQISFADAPALETIGQNAFSGAAIVDLVIPSSVRTISDEAFSDCTPMTTLSLTEGLEVIGHRAFSGCTNLSGHLYLPSTINDFGNNIFEAACQWTDVEIYTSETNLPRFTDCQTLTTAVIGGNMRYLPNDCFENCTNLTSVTISAPLLEIGWSSFKNCTSLTSLQLPDTLTTIGNGAFINTGLVELIIPDAVEDLGQGAVRGCQNLTTVTLGAGIRRIENFAFQDCVNLSSVDLCSATYIGSSAFQNCSALTCIEIPDTVTSIASGTFARCAALGKIVFLGDAPSFSSNRDSFNGITAIALYPADNPTWTEEVMQDYGGHITWVPDNHPHEYESVVTAPTCTESGCTTHTCTVCGDTYISDEIPALGHTFEDGYCTVCGASERAMGDVNNDGEIDIFDANLIVACYNGTTDLDADQQKAADVNGDGEVDIFDANLVVAFYNGTLSAFPLA